jgi:hypothetical protein
MDQFDVELAFPCIEAFSRGVRRRSGARNPQSQSRHRYFLFVMNRRMNHSRPVASRNLSLFDPHAGHGMTSV